jgi:hypothetical protein
MAPKLQIFFVSRSFQDLFFLVSQEPITLLVDLVQDLVDALLGNIRYLFEGLCTRDLVIEFVFGGTTLFYTVGIEEIVTPIEKMIHPERPVISAAKQENEKISQTGAGKICNIGAVIAGGDP